MVCGGVGGPPQACVGPSRHVLFRAWRVLEAPALSNITPAQLLHIQWAQFRFDQGQAAPRLCNSPAERMTIAMTRKHFPSFRLAAACLVRARCGPALSVLTATLSLVACGGGGSSDTTTAGTTSPGATTSAGVQCSYSSSAFNSTPSVNATSTAAWSCAGTQRLLVANGLPDHAVGAFPNANNPNAITAQTVSASLKLTPALTTTVTTLGPGTVPTGYVLNGVKIDAATAGACTDAGTCSLIGNTGNWNIEALGQTSFNFGADSNNAHVQPGGAYHYHGVPEGFVAKLGKGPTLTLIGWAADGFPIYARYGYTVATDASSAIKVIRSSYRLKTSVAANRPALSTYALGAFKQDYEYVAGLGDLDECNGRTGVTPEFPLGTYHYYATDTYPFLQRCVKGQL